MDIYKIIREAKDTEELISNEDIDYLFEPLSNKVMFSIINNEDNELFKKLSEMLLRKREEYSIAEKENTLDDFYKDIISELKKILKTDKHSKLKEFLDYIKEHSENFNKIVNAGKKDPEAALFKLFLSEYNSKPAFSWTDFKHIKDKFEKSTRNDFVWTQFKELRKQYKYNKKAFKPIEDKFKEEHPLECGDVTKLKSFLEKYSTIQKIDKYTIFSKEQHTLPDSCIKKMLEKINPTDQTN